MNFTLCEPESTYVVVEQIHSKSGMPSVSNLPGPSLQQVFRRVARVCSVQDTYYNGHRLDGNPSVWQFLKDFLLPGQQITTRRAGESRFYLAYAGFNNILQPLPWTEKYDLGPPPVAALSYGVDPIPDVRLYGHPQAQFVSLGGDSAPTAIGIYRQEKRHLEFPAVTERESIIKRLLVR